MKTSIAIAVGDKLDTSLWPSFAAISAQYRTRSEIEYMGSIQQERTMCVELHGRLQYNTVLHFFFWCEVGRGSMYRSHHRETRNTYSRLCMPTGSGQNHNSYFKTKKKDL